MSVMLIGLPGSGKTTLGRAAAKRLNRPFIDMDEYIEQQAGMTVSDIFAVLGEAAFRDMESEAVRALADTDALIACGGGAVLRAENRLAMRAGGPVVFIDRPVDCILCDIDVSRRPLLASGADRLIRLSREREALYRETATAVLPNPGERREAEALLVSIIREAIA